MRARDETVSKSHRLVMCGSQTNPAKYLIGRGGGEELR